MSRWIGVVWFGPPSQSVGCAIELSSGIVAAHGGCCTSPASAAGIGTSGA
tara:strand:- start:17 stop:166 length:150 start_codon:yes stop_codon:yes gene_type:complete